MADLFLELTVLASLAVIVYLMAAAVPRIEEEQEEEKTAKINLHLDRLDSFLVRAKDKFLRRMKVLVMRFDNFISRQLRPKKP